VFCLKPIKRPASELVEWLACEGAEGNFLELALISCLPDSDLVHFTWYHANDSECCAEIEQLVKHGWIPP
jgi:hypothetical protein